MLAQLAFVVVPFNTAFVHRQQVGGSIRAGFAKIAFATTDAPSAFSGQIEGGGNGFGMWLFGQNIGQTTHITTLAWAT